MLEYLIIVCKFYNIFLAVKRKALNSLSWTDLNFKNRKL